MATDDNTTERKGPGPQSPSPEELEAENPVEAPRNPTSVRATLSAARHKNGRPTAPNPSAKPRKAPRD